MFLHLRRSLRRLPWYDVPLSVFEAESRCLIWRLQGKTSRQDVQELWLGDLNLQVATSQTAQDTHIRQLDHERPRGDVRHRDRGLRQLRVAAAAAHGLHALPGKGIGRRQAKHKAAPHTADVPRPLGEQCHDGQFCRDTPRAEAV